MISDSNYKGCGCIDFKIFNQQLYIFEFNTRLAGRLILHNNNMHNFSGFEHSLVTSLSLFLALSFFLMLYDVLSELINRKAYARQQQDKNTDGNFK
jgi:hypothetical protein